MRSLLRRIAPRRRLLKLIGFDFDFYSAIEKEVAVLRLNADLDWLVRRHRFATLIDIGANDGKYGAFLGELFGIQRMIAFEPLRQHAESLRARRFEVHTVALGEAPDVAPLRINSEDASSSLLPLGAPHRAEWPEREEVGTVEVPVRRLDDLVPRNLVPEILIKIDAQGLEDAIIRGGIETFRAASAVLVEMSFVPLYEGQPLFDAVHAQLAELGFRLAGIRDQSLARSTGQPLFAHCVYER